MGRPAAPLHKFMQHSVKYARLTDKGEWEYGHINCLGASKTYVKRGIAASLMEASAVNDISFGEWAEDPSAFQPLCTYKVKVKCSGKS